MTTITRPLALLAFIAAPLAATLGSPVRAQDDALDVASIRSTPKDLTEYARPTDPGDWAFGRIHPKVFLRDVVVSNTDLTLTNTDVANDGELSIAVNPANHDEIVITSFAAPWGANAPLWHSTDGGATCDQTVDWARDNALSGTFLSFNPTNVYTGMTTDPTNAAAWNWLVVAGSAERTNQVALNVADQPWLLVNRDPSNPGQDNLYVAYDDFSGAPDMRVAVSFGTLPPEFATDVRTGFSTGFVNPGHRLAGDAHTGAMYSIWQRRIAPGAGGSKNIDYMLNRSTDAGLTWPLGGGNGIVVANGDSTQPTPKFGTVNALLGGVLHATVHKQTGDLYYVYGKRDAITGNNRLAIRRLTTDHTGPFPSSVTRFVGDPRGAQPDVFVESLEPGDRLVLCSDGLTRHLADQDIAVRAKGSDLKKDVDALVDLANERGGQDNITVVLYAVPSRFELGDLRHALISVILAILVLVVIAGAVAALIIASGAVVMTR